MTQFTCPTCRNRFVEDSMDAFCPECLSDVKPLDRDEVFRVIEEFDNDNNAITDDPQVADVFRATGHTVIEDVGKQRFIIRKKPFFKG